VQITKILQRLEACANGDVEMGPDQIQAAKIILNKLIPDMKAVELSGPEGGPVMTANLSSDDIKNRVLKAIPQAELDKLLEAVKK
jgi:hypothetical protein